MDWGKIKGDQKDVSWCLRLRVLNSVTDWRKQKAPKEVN
jgi:hypothetical protein